MPRRGSMSNGEIVFAIAVYVALFIYVFGIDVIARGYVALVIVLVGGLAVRSIQWRLSDWRKRRAARKADVERVRAGFRALEYPGVDPVWRARLRDEVVAAARQGGYVRGGERL